MTLLISTFTPNKPLTPLIRTYTRSLMPGTDSDDIIINNHIYTRQTTHVIDKHISTVSDARYWQWTCHVVRLDDVTIQNETIILQQDTQWHNQTSTHTHIHIQVFIRLWGSRTLHLITCHTSQLPTNSQQHSPTWILPHNLTNIIIHAHTMPTNTSPTRTCKVTMERGFS